MFKVDLSQHMFNKGFAIFYFYLEKTANTIIWLWSIYNILLNYNTWAYSFQLQYILKMLIKL